MNVKKQYFILPLLIFFRFAFNLGFSQNQAKVDNLLQEFETTKEDTNKVIVLNKLCWEYINTDPNQSMEYATQALALAEKIGYKKGISTSLNFRGIAYDQKGSYEKALEDYAKSLSIAEEMGDKKKHSAVLKNIGIIYERKGDFKKALDYYIKSLKIREETGNKNGIASSLNAIGIVYKNLGRYEEAITHYEEALKLWEETGNRNSSAYALTNIAGVYYFQDDYEKALEYSLMTLKIMKEAGNKYGIANSLSNIGELYNELGDYDKAIIYHDKSLKINEELEDKRGVATSFIQVGSLYIKTENNKKAIEVITKGLQLAKEIGAKPIIKAAYEELSYSYASLDNYEKAYEYHQLYSAMKDSVFNEETTEKIAEMQIKYETEKKQKENEILTKETKIQALQLSRNKYLMYGLTGVTVLVIVIALLFIQQNKLRTQQRTMQLEQRLLRSQMNPHFISNSLIAIQSFIYKKDPKEAGKYLANFAKLMRLILENSREEYVPLEKEIKTLEHYLELQTLRFENKFDYSIDMAPEIDAETIAIPPMLAQPFIENALEHGILHKNTDGKISVRFNLEGDLVLLEVEDNGIGRQKAAELKQTDKKAHQSLATTITQERLTILNKKNRQKIKLNITDLKSPDDDVVGTRATFHIPFRNV